MNFITGHTVAGTIVALLAPLAAAQSSDRVVRTDSAGQEAAPNVVYSVSPVQENTADQYTAARTPQVLRAYAGSSMTTLGIFVSPVPPAMSAQLKLRRNLGLIVESVVPGSAAEKAGIEQYDVIEKVDGRPVRGWQQFQQMLMGHKAGDSASVSVIRQGEHRDMNVSIPSDFLRSGQSSNGPENPIFNSRRFAPDLNFKFSPDQTRQMDELTTKLRDELQKQEQQIEQLKQNLRRQADQARRELEQLKDQIRREVDQQKKQMLDELKDNDKTKQDKDREDNQKRF